MEISNASSWPKLRFTNVQDGGVPHMRPRRPRVQENNSTTEQSHWTPLPCKFMNRYTVYQLGVWVLLKAENPYKNPASVRESFFPFTCPFGVFPCFGQTYLSYQPIYHTKSFIILFIISNHIISITSHHITSYHIISHHIIPYPLVNAYITMENHIFLKENSLWLGYFQ